MGNTVSQIGDTLEDAWNDTLGFADKVGKGIGAGAQGFFDDAYQLIDGSGFGPTDAVTYNTLDNLYINNVIESQWSKVNRAMIDLYRKGIQYESEKNSRRYRTMTPTYQLSQQDEKTIFVNISKNDIPLSSTIYISCACANLVNPLVIYIDESIIDFVTLGDIRFPENINIFTYSRITNTMNRIEIKDMKVLN